MVCLNFVKRSLKRGGPVTWFVSELREKIDLSNGVVQCRQYSQNKLLTWFVPKLRGKIPQTWGFSVGSIIQHITCPGFGIGQGYT